MTDHAPDAPVAPDAPDAPDAPVAPGFFRRIGWGVRRILAIAAIILAVAFVTTITVDLGPALRQLAEKGGAGFLKRDFTIGRLSIRLLTGTFVVENLRIGGLEKADRPFLVAKTIEVSMSFPALLHREVLVDSVVMSDWQMVVETWAGGKHSFPKFTRDSKQPAGPKRFTTTVAYVLAQRGQFTFEDHDVPWSTVARNIEVVVSKSRGYGGTARFTDGTVTIQHYQPMRTDMRGWFTIDGPNLRLSRLDLLSDGARLAGSFWPR